MCLKENEVWLGKAMLQMVFSALTLLCCAGGALARGGHGGHGGHGSGHHSNGHSETHEPSHGSGGHFYHGGHSGSLGHSKPEQSDTSELLPESWYATHSVDTPDEEKCERENIENCRNGTEDLRK